MSPNVTPIETLKNNERRSRSLTISGLRLLGRIPLNIIRTSPGYGTLERSLETSKHADSQRKLFGKRIAAVGLARESELSLDHPHGELVLSRLIEREIVDRHRPLSIRTATNEFSSRKSRSALTKGARALMSAILSEKPSDETTLDTKPIIMDSELSPTGRFYRAINHAVEDTDEMMEEFPKRDAETFTKDPAIIILMENMHIAEALKGKGISLDVIKRTGIVTLELVGQVPRDNMWLEGPFVPYRPRVETTNVPTGTPIQSSEELAMASR